MIDFITLKIKKNIIKSDKTFTKPYFSLMKRYFELIKCYFSTKSLSIIKLKDFF